MFYREEEVHPSETRDGGHPQDHNTSDSAHSDLVAESLASGGETTYNKELGPKVRGARWA